jgi:hypothetical protein
MKKWLAILTAAGLLLYPFAAIAADYGSQPSQEQQVPPVAQTLVREGDFAIKLAAELDLGNPSDEATAEDMLTAAGVVPANGWLSDYPMTPEIIGQLKDAVSKAATEGKLHMNADGAVKSLYSLAAQMNLPTPAGTGSEAQEGSQQTPQNPSVVNNYYYDQGPPVITYYPPPYDYWYLYHWVPYPVFWFGYWFPGYYICHNFTTVVVSPVFFNRRIVTNHVIDPVTRRVAIVDPVTRTGNGVRPMTVLRTADGRTFSSLLEMRREMGSLVTKAPESRIKTGSAYRGGGFTTRESQQGAESIFRRSMDRTHSAPADLSSQDNRFRSYSPPGRKTGEGQRYKTPAPSGRSYDGQSLRKERQAVPRMPERSYDNYNYNYGGSWQGGDRSYSAPRVPSKTFDAPKIRGSGDRWQERGVRRGR